MRGQAAASGVVAYPVGGRRRGEHGEHLVEVGRGARERRHARQPLAVSVDHRFDHPGLVGDEDLRHQPLRGPALQLRGEQREVDPGGGVPLLAEPRGTIAPQAAARLDQPARDERRAIGVVAHRADQSVVLIAEVHRERGDRAERRAIGRATLLAEGVEQQCAPRTRERDRLPRLDPDAERARHHPGRRRTDLEHQRARVHRGIELVGGAPPCVHERGAVEHRGTDRAGISGGEQRLRQHQADPPARAHQLDRQRQELGGHIGVRAATES